MKTNLLPTKLRFKVHARHLIREMVEGNPSGGIMVIPANLLLNALTRIAERCAQLGDPVLDGLMCELALYSAADPDTEDYDHERAEATIQTGEETAAALRAADQAGK